MGGGLSVSTISPPAIGATWTRSQRKLAEAFGDRFRFIEGDIRDRDACAAAVEGVDFVLHQAALGSVPRSIADPLTSHDVNITGFLNMLDAARRAGVGRFVYAASSSTYGDSQDLPKREEQIGNPLSPYAATKLANEIYASVYARSYGFKATGLRYFNVFGPRQDPNGAYAAVIPKWTAAMIGGEPVTINGDGQTSRDFCYVANAVQANLRAALAADEAQGEVYNVAVGERTSLVELFALLGEALERHQVHYGLGAGDRAISAPATSATRWPTSARPGTCWAISRRTGSARASTKPCPGISTSSASPKPPPSRPACPGSSAPGDPARP